MKRPHSNKYNFALVSLLLGLLIWILDALLESYVLSDIQPLDTFSYLLIYGIYVRIGVFIILGIILTYYISRLKSSEQKLIEESEMLRITLQSIGDAVITTDTDGRVTMMNSIAEKLCGFSFQEAQGKPIREVFHIINETTRLPVESPVDIVLQKGVIVGLANHTILIARDGMERYIADSGAPIRDNGEIWGVVLVFRDVTEDRQMRQQIEESEQLYKTLFENIPSGVAIYKAISNENSYDFIFKNFNSSGERIEKVNRQELIGRSVCKVFPGVKETRLYNVLLRVHQTGVAEHHSVSLYNGEKMVGWRENYICKLHSGELVAIYEDVTERKQMELELVAREKELTLQNQIAQIFLTVSEDQIYLELMKHIIHVVQSDYGFIGYLDSKGNLVCPIKLSRADAEKDIPLKPVSVPREKWGGIWAQAMLETKTVCCNTFYSRLLSENIPLQRAVALPIVYQESTIGVIAVANKKTDYDSQDIKFLEQIRNYVSPILYARLQRDVHKEKRKTAEMERQNIQDQLIQAQKMETIGRLSSGIAHDFNNILTGIMGYAEMLSLQFRPNTEENKAAEIIIRSVERAASLTRRLLDFSRKSKFNPVPLNINDLIPETVKVLEKIFEKTIRVRYNLYPSINTVQVDKNQIDQVFTNLIINARDAIYAKNPDRPYGEIIFTTQNVTIDSDYLINFPEVKEGSYVKITIEDNGIGMKPDVRMHIFEPFFTTKDVGKGTGLGLATAYGIIKNHNGHIDCMSEDGKGTTFIIYLPTSSQNIAAIQENTTLIQGNKTILLVDDEETIRKIMRKHLENLGYKVFDAQNGFIALEIYEKNKNWTDLILLDVVMPDMGGKETFHKLRQINPNAKVILVSGVEDDKPAEILKEGAIGFIRKPFKLHELSKILHDSLA